MTDLEFFKEFTHRFNLDGDDYVERNNYSEVHTIPIKDENEEERGAFVFEFVRGSGELIDTPYFSDYGEGHLEERLQAMTYDEILNLFDFLTDLLRNNFN